MSARHEKLLSDVTEERLDRLVDGELSRDEYRALLESLDRERDGWRRCALAFLEAQAWQRELPVVRAEGFAGAATKSQSADTHRSGTGSGSVWSTWAGRLALAASWFLVFALGASSYQAFFASDGRDSNFVSPGGRIGASSGPNTNVATKGNSPSTANLADGSITSGAIPAIGSGLEFQIADPQGNVLNRYVMPVNDSGTAVDSYGAASQPAVPDELAHAARAAKFDLRTNRTWIPVQVQNGGNVLLPLDHIELQPRPARLPY